MIIQQGKSSFTRRVGSDNNPTVEALRQECVEAIKWLRQLGSSPYFERQEGTCTWVQKTEEWSTWTSQSYSQPLCICGPPGSYPSFQ
jgi:hypothetical protein